MTGKGPRRDNWGTRRDNTDAPCKLISSSEASRSSPSLSSHTIEVRIDVHLDYHETSDGGSFSLTTDPTLAVSRRAGKDTFELGFTIPARNAYDTSPATFLTRSFVIRFVR